MANRTVGVNIAFNADTSKAKAQIQELQTLLNKITYSGATGAGQNKISDDLKNASAAAKELQYHLNNAYNANTGKLDLSLLDKSLKTTGSNITNLSTNLLSAGATGQQAFVKMAQSISQAEQPMLKINSKVKDFANTLKNAAKYQIGNVVVQGFMSSITSAIGYAKDLNSSLNEIRIVSGKSADEMARFAEEANKAAKRLSTTTTDYTNASLIYYQQGLSEADVAARTETTIKMANVAGTSAQTVSDQMTAVWNNFYDGSKSLEYYSDVMVKLGAATASSTDEISQGVNKFAATAKTVGLSYEYATAALATVTATTRESADTVGNAFKTLFSRIQGLNLGETLDDGTTLNKYSKALQSVGISIKDQGGQLKEMDQILDEMGDKWGTLGEAEKMALAQTVGGARQYTQLMALMENWDYFKENLDVAYNSEGALEEQAKVYEESWAAASKRVEASLQGVYQSLLDDKFFISINNGFANALGGLEAFIEGAGGAKTIITGLASVIIGAFANKIPDALQTAKYNFDLLTKGSEVAYKKIQDQMQTATNLAFKGYKTDNGQEIKIDKDSSTGMELQYSNELLAAKNKLAQITDKLSAAEKQHYESELSLVEVYQKETVALREQTEELEHNIEVQRQEMNGAAKAYGFNDDKVFNKVNDIYGKKQTSLFAQVETLDKMGLNKEAQKTYNQYEAYGQASETFSKVVDELNNFQIQINNAYDEINDTIVNGLATGNTDGFELKNYFDSALGPLDNIKEKLQGISELDIDSSDKLITVKTTISAISDTIPEALQKATGLSEIFAKIGKENSVDGLLADIDELISAMNKAKIEGKDYSKVLKAFQDTKDVNKFTSNVDALAEKFKELNDNKAALEALMNSFKPTHIVATTEAVVSLASVLGSITTIGNSFSSMIKNWFNPDLSGWEKISATFTALPMIVFSGISAIKNLGTSFEFADSKLTAHLALETLLKTNMTDVVNVIGKKNSAELISIALAEKSAGKAKEAAAAQLAKKLETEHGIEANIAEAMSQEIVNAAYDTGKASLGEYIAEKAVHIVQEKILHGEQAKSIVLQTILNALMGDFGGTIGKILLILGGGLIIGAIVGLVKLIDLLVVTQKEATQAIADANDAYEEEKNKADELTSSLKSLQEQIEELANKDTLTITEEEELKKLREEEASLKRQLALQEQLAKAKQREAAQTFEDNFKTSSKWVDKAPDTKTNIFMQGKLTPQEYFEKYVEPTQKLFDEDPDNTKLAEKLDKYKQKYQEMLDKEAQARADYIEKYQDDYNTLVEGYKNWLEQNPTASKTDKEQYATKIQEANKNFYGEDNWQEVVYGSVSSAKSAAEKKSGSTFTSWVNDVYAAGSDLTEAGGQLADTFSTEFKNELYANGIIPEEYAQWLVDEQQRKIETVAGKLGVKGSEILQNAMKDSRWTDNALDALDSIDFSNINTSNLDELFNAIENFYATNVVQDLRADLEALITTTSELSIGDILSEEDYQLLLKYNKELEKYFIYTGKGYKYLGGADDEIANLGVDEYLNKMEQRKKGAEYFDTYRITGTGERVNWTSLISKYQEDGSGYGRQTLANFKNDENAMEYITQIDEKYTEDYLQGIIDQLNSSEESVKAEGEKLAKEFWNAFNNAYTEGSEWTDSKANEVRYSQATNLNQLGKIHTNLEDEEAYSKQLIAIGNEYENCQEEVIKYNKAIEKSGKNSQEAKKAGTALLRAIRSEEWKKVTKACMEYIDELETLTDPTEIQNAYEKIAKTFNDTFDTSITSDFVSDNISLFKEWSQASEEEANDIAQKIYYLANIASNVDSVEIDFNVNEGEVQTTFDDIQSAADWLKSYIESNDITVDVHGRADLTEMIANMLAAGRTAGDVAAVLQVLGESEIDTSTWGSGMKASYPSTLEGMLDFIKDLSNFHGGFKVNENGSVSASAGAIEDVFGKSKIYGTGGGGGATSNSNKNKGGGGGSKPKHAEKKNDSDKERYHTLTNQLEDIKAEYDDISEASDRAFGKDKLKNLDAQIEKTDELIDKQEEYLDAIEANLPVDKAVMDAYYQDTIGGPALEYDERGNIANYDAIQDAMFAKYNSMADAYDEDSTEWQVFEKKYEQLEKYIEQYEETYDLLRDQEQEYQDLLNQRIDLQLEKVQYTVELKLNVSEDQVKLIEYQLDKVEDDGFKSLEAIGLLTAKANELNNQMQINKQGLNEALGLTLSLQEIQQIMAGNMDVLNGRNFTEDQIDAIKEYRDNLLDLNGEFDDIRENIEDKMMETFDAWNEKLETGIDLLDHYGSILESYQNIVDIVGQDTMGLSEEFIANLSQGQVDNAIDKVEATKKAYESLEQARAAAEDKLNEARANGDAASQEMWEKTLEELTEHSQEAQENMLSAWEEALSSIADQFELTVERVVKNFNDAVYSLGGLEGLADDFSKQQERADIMLDDYQKIYELSKLSRDINKSIDDTDLIGGKQKLKKLLGEVNALQEDGVEMSQYDLEYLQKTYDLRLAELELEEAQRAKNTVRLSKDNEGNWSYVYTQNTDAVDAAQQKYEDALYAMQDLSSNYIDEMSEKLIETSQEMAEALAELRVEDFASIDDYYAEVDRVQKYYQEQMEFQENELDKAIANNKTLYDEDWTAYHNATGYKISDTEDFVTAFKDSMLGTLMNSNSDVANFNDLIAGSVDGLTQGLLQAADTYYRNLEEAMNAAGTSTETFGQDIGEQIGQVVAKSEEGAAAVEDMADRMNAAINGTMDAIVSWQQSYGLAMEQIIQSNLDVIESFNEMLATLSGVGEGVTVSYDIAKNGSTTAEPERFASGGYTGNWGNSGKLGILDEKELILNQNDTVNMLNMLQLTHDLLDMIDLQTQSAKLGFGNLVASTIKDSQKEVLEQKVEITAEFPNVSDHNEIEEALMNLTNTASQYANRK